MKNKQTKNPTTKKNILFKCFGLSLFYQCTVFYFCYSYCQNRLMPENTSKKRIPNFSLQILSVFCQLPLKNWNNTSKTTEKEEVQFWLRKHFWKLKRRKLMEIYCPTLLSCSIFHWACTNFEVYLSLHFEDRRAELKCEGQSFATLFRVVYGKICWNCSIRIITSLELDQSNSLGWHFQMKPPHPFFLIVAFIWKKQMHTRCIETFPTKTKTRGVSHGMLFQPAQTVQGKVRCFRTLHLREIKPRTSVRMQWNSPS